jgi:hypothetical protein
MSQKPTRHAQGASPGLGPTASMPGPWPLRSIGLFFFFFPFFFYLFLLNK